jgi:hypothetical protein
VEVKTYNICIVTILYISHQPLLTDDELSLIDCSSSENVYQRTAMNGKLLD